MIKKTDLIAYCGLYCGSCPAYTQSLTILSKDMLKELRRSKLDKSALALAKIPAFGVFKNYGKFCEVLDFLSKMKCPIKTCRAAKGSTKCKIRKCVIEKGFDGCWECDDFETCKKLKMLEKYGDIDKTYMKNLRKIKKQGLTTFIKSQKD